MVPALHSVVLDHVLTGRGLTYWIDAGGRARTTTLCELAPDPRVLDRIQIARGFTPYQHFTLISTLDSRTVETPGIVVCPAFDRLYRETDLPESDSKEFLLRGLAVVAGIGRRNDIPVLLTRTEDDDLSAPLEAAANEIIQCESTRYGPRFVGEDFETLVYPESDGWVQTTLAFWKRILASRVQIGSTFADEAGPEVIADGAH